MESILWLVPCLLTIIETRTAMIEMTTSNSMMVKPRREQGIPDTSKLRITFGGANAPARKLTLNTECIALRFNVQGKSLSPLRAELSPGYLMN